MNRKNRILKHIPKNGSGLEIGPCHNPIAPKKENFNVEIMDHATREELIQKYSKHNILFENIEEVDHIWQPHKNYSEITGKNKHYDWIIASHVIEHVPDLIGFLLECDSILKDDGCVSLAIPDKRYCFDYYRPVTGLARVIDCHMGNHGSGTPGTAVEQYLYQCEKAGSASWNDGTIGPTKLVNDKNNAQSFFDEIVLNKQYVDAHNWCFTPHQFRLLIQDLHDLNLIPFKEKVFYDTNGCEFYIVLSRKGEGLDCSREKTLNRIVKENRKYNSPITSPINFAIFLCGMLVKKIFGPNAATKILLFIQAKRF